MIMNYEYELLFVKMFFPCEVVTAWLSAGYTENILATSDVCFKNTQFYKFIKNLKILVTFLSFLYWPNNALCVWSLLIIMYCFIIHPIFQWK